MVLRPLVFVGCSLLATTPLIADDTKLDIRGIRLGMTREDVQKSAEYPCSLRDDQALVCAQSNDVAKGKVLPRYFVEFVGEPASAASISYEFCSSAAFLTIQRDALSSYGAVAALGRKVDRGFQFPVAKGVDVRILETPEVCGLPPLRQYELTIVDEDLVATDSTASMPDQSPTGDPATRMAPKF